MSPAPPSISPRDLAQRLKAGDLVVLDVREPAELAIARLDPVLHIPMHELPHRLEDLSRDQPIAVLCHHGVRSFMVASWLMENGFPDALNVQGGIDAWSHTVDPDVPRY